MTEIRWYDEDVRLVVDNATQEFLLALAFQVEAEAKTDPAMPVDTGFLRNSSYVNGMGKNTFKPQTQILKSKKSKSKTKHSTVPSVGSPPEGEVHIGFSADYAIYMELLHNFLYNALVRVSKQAPATIETVGRKHFG